MGIDGKRLRALREARGLYHQDVADYLGVTRQAYMKYENGSVKNPRKINELAQFFNVTTDYLLGNDHKDQQDDRPDLPPLTPRDERAIAKDLEKLLAEMDSAAAMGGELDAASAEDRELLISSLRQSLTLAKRLAKAKFTPKKYRKNQE